MFECQECNKLFSSNDNLSRHIKFIHDELQLLCEICGKTMSNLRNLKEHQRKTHNIRVTFENPKKRVHSIGIDNEGSMNKKKKNSSSSDASINTDPEKTSLCEKCNVQVLKKNMHNHLKSFEHKNKILRMHEIDENIQITQSAFKSRIVSYRLSDRSTEHISLKEFINSIRMKTNDLLKLQIDDHNAIKTNFELYAMYTKYDSKD